MKYSLILLSLVLLSACSSMKKQCISIALTAENASMVQANPANSMYIFSFGEGPLLGAEMHINSQENGVEKDLFIMNPAKPNAVFETLNKEAWKWKEAVNEEKMTASLKASIEFLYDGKHYCATIDYAGESMKMMMPPPAPVPVPAPER